MSYAARRKGDRLRLQGRESHVAFLGRIPQVGESLEREAGFGGLYGYGGLGEWF